MAKGWLRFGCGRWSVVGGRWWVHQVSLPHLLLAELGELKDLVGEPALDGSVRGDRGGEVRGLPSGELLHGSNESGHLSKVFGLEVDCGGRGGG